MKITDKIHELKIPFNIPIGPGQLIPRFVNVLLIFEERITLVDTGVKGSEEEIFSYIEQNHRDRHDIASVILSHSHPDHIGSASRIKEITGCKVYAHEAERVWIENIDIQNQERPVPGFYSLVDQPVTVDHGIEDGQIFVAGEGETMRMIHSPGHSPGSLNIFFTEDRILFTADSVPLKNDIPNYDHYHDLMKSLMTIRNRRDISLLLSSWTPPVNGTDEIENLTEEGADYMMKINEIVNEVYRGREQMPLEHCIEAVKKLGLPHFLATPLVDGAFRSHFQPV